MDKLTVGRMDSEVAQLLLLMLTASVEPKRAAPLNSVTAIAAELIFDAVLVCNLLVLLIPSESLTRRGKRFENR